MELSPDEFASMQRLIQSLCGLAIGNDKEYLVRNRLGPVVRKNRCSSFAAFLRRLADDPSPELRHQIIEAITTGETSFRRDGHPFDAFRRHILPNLLERIAEESRTSGARPARARIWSAGTATGQEAYSLAIEVAGFLASPPGSGLRAENFSILGTDISNRSLAAAAQGRYLARDLARGISPDERRQFFSTDGDHWTVNESIRRMVEWRRINLTEPFPQLDPMDAIFCRNVLIYFDDATRRRVCEQFHRVLRPGGFLVLGAVENLFGIADQFVSTRYGDTLVYRKPSLDGAAELRTRAAM